MSPRDHVHQPRGLSILSKATAIAIAVLGVFSMVVAYAMETGLVNLSSGCPGNRPCLLLALDSGAFALFSLGMFLLVFSLLIWLLGGRVYSKPAHGPFGPPINGQSV